MKDIPHHVPIRKENRWEPIQHYATAPNTAVASIPIRRPIVSDLLMPERQESVSSYISQHSSQIRLRHSNRSLASMSREDFNDDSTTTPFSPMQQQRRWRNASSSILSSPSSQSSRYSCKQPVSSKSLFSSSPLATTFEVQKNGGEDSYRKYSSSLNNFVYKPLMPRAPTKNDPNSSGGDNWFQHSDDSSLSQDEETHFNKPFSDRSIGYIIDEYESDNSTSHRKHTVNGNRKALETESSTASPEMTPGRAIITEESVNRVLRESAKHSRIISGDQTTASDTASTKLDRLREKMKRLREKNHQQILQSRFQHQRTRSSTQNKMITTDESEDTMGRPFLSRNKSFLHPSKKQISNNSPSLERLDSFSQSTAVSDGFSGNSNRFQDASLHRTQCFSPSTSIPKTNCCRSGKPSMHFFSKSTGMKMIPKENAWTNTDLSNLSDSESDSWSLDSNLSHERSQATEEDDKEVLECNSRENRNSRRISHTFVPHASLSSRCMSIAEEGEEDEVAEEKEVTAEPTIDYDPAFDPDLDINSSFDSSKRDSSQEHAEENKLDEDLYINSSFDSSKCSSIAEEVIQSLRAERRTLNPVSPKEEAQTERQYDSSVHITRNYSIGRSAKKAASPSSSPTRSPLQQKLERRGRRPKSKRSPKAKQEKRISLDDVEISPEAKNLAQELREALSARGPPVPADEETNHPWCDPIQSDGILPLASEDSLSSPAITTPKTFQEKRKAYLERIGDSDECRHQSPFTTANWVLGKLPEKPPIHDSSVESSEYREEPEISPMKTYRGSPNKRNSRKNIRKIAYDVSPSQNKTNLISSQKSPSRSRRPPHREEGRSGSSQQAGDQNSFVSKVAERTQTRKINKNQSPSTKRRSKSSREKVGRDANKSSSRSLMSNKSDEIDGKCRKSTSARKVPRDASDSLLDNELVGSTREESIRRLVRSKSSKEKEGENIAALRSNPTRNSSKSSLDQSGERQSSELSKQLLRIDSNLSMEEKNKRQNNSKPSVERGRDASSKGLSKTVVRNNRKSQRSPRKSLRSPSQTPEKRKDRSIKKYDEMDSIACVPNTSSTQKPSSWRVATRQSESKTVDDDTPVKPSSGRFVSRFRNLSKDRSSKKPSSGRFGKSARKKEGKGTKKPSSGRFGAIVSKFSNDKEDEKKFGSYQRLDESSSEDLEEDIRRSQKSLSTRKMGKSHRFRSSPSRGSLTRKTSSGDLFIRKTSVDQRDDSNRSLANKPKRPSSWRDDAARSIGRNHSHLSNTGTAVTVDSDPTSNGSGSESQHEEVIVAKNDAKKTSKSDDLNTSKHGRRTRPRRNTSHRSAMRRLRRYKDYRKNGVLVAEQKRFHIDMTGGIQ